jgi:hypothetical protein
MEKITSNRINNNPFDSCETVEDCERVLKALNYQTERSYQIGSIMLKSSHPDWYKTESGWKKLTVWQKVKRFFGK